MTLTPASSKGKESNLETVNVISFSENPKAGLWIDALQENGAEMLKDTDIQALQDITRQKLAVIFDQDISEERMIEIIEKYEKICGQDPLMSLRFFCLKWNKEISNENDRLRIIDIHKVVLPGALPARLNHTLYKARLPIFLRKNYNVGIFDVLEPIDQVYYRPIVIRKYEKEGIERSLKYSTEGLFIHNKELYSRNPKTEKMEIMDEFGQVWIKENSIGKFAKIAQRANLMLLKDETEEE